MFLFLTQAFWVFIVRICFFRFRIWAYLKSLNGDPQSVMLFDSILLSHSKKVNAKVVSFLNLHRLLIAVIKKVYNFDAC